MNTQQPNGAATLPELTDDRVDRIESGLFAEISRERTSRSKRRTGAWMIGGAAAAVIVVAAVIAPSVGSLIGGAGGLSTEGSAVPGAAPFTPTEGGASDTGVVSEGADSGAGSSIKDMAELEGTTRSAVDDNAADRAIITTASATVMVDDISAAAAVIADAAESRDGYVESMSIGRSGQVMPVEPVDGGFVYDSTMPYPYTPDGAWITVRVPADGLQSLVDQLAGVGEVTASAVNRQDVTEVTLDLEARVEAAQASVDRLTELMTQAGSLADLIAAESALSERQAMLESLQQQLKYYDEQIAMSTLTVTLTPEVETVAADPAGFGDGLVAGWNGLVATLNGIVVAIGFLLPWLVVLVIAGLIAWGIVRLVRRRKVDRGSPSVRVPPAGPAEGAIDQD